MTVRDILGTKGDHVVTVPPETTVRAAMTLLVEHNIGALVVFEQTIRGIITERDLLRTAAKDPARLNSATVADLMTRDLVVGSPDEPIQRVMKLMTEHRIRHLPIVEGGTLRGLVSIGDVVNALRDSAETENKQLYAYIAGTPL